MQGLEVGQCEITLHVRPCEGLVRQLDGTIEKHFSKKELLCPIQVLRCAMSTSLCCTMMPCMRDTLYLWLWLSPLFKVGMHYSCCHSACLNLGLPSIVAHAH